MRGLTPSTDPTTPVRVLKFGGSVLRDEHTIAKAAREVVRFRKRGEHVVAVVSALHGVTDRTLARARHLTEARAEPIESACPHALASAISIGEHESASWLALHLGLLGHAAPVLTPAALSLTARGDPLDAEPVSVDLARLEHALDTHAVAVVPGFAAIDERARCVTLGRGGSDLTALFLAASLRDANHPTTCRPPLPITSPCHPHITCNHPPPTTCKYLRRRHCNHNGRLHCRTAAASSAKASVAARKNRYS